MVNDCCLLCGWSSYLRSHVAHDTAIAYQGLMLNLSAHEHQGCLMNEPSHISLREFSATMVRLDIIFCAVFTMALQRVSLLFPNVTTLSFQPFT